MYTATWNLDVAGAQHEVKLEWTYWGGERHVFIDGKEVDGSHIPMRWKSTQEVEVEGKQIVVITRPHSVTHPSRFDVLLEVDGKEIEPDSNTTDHGVR